MAANLKLVRRAIAVPTFNSDSAQEEVISFRGSLGVFGKAGSGKTTTLIRSALSRMDAGQDPNTVLIITYGRESASIIRDQIAIGAKSTATNPLARTFHSLAFSILNEKLSPEDPMYILVSGAEQDAFIGEMLESGFDKSAWHEDLDLAKKTKGFVREVRDLILRGTELGLLPEDLKQLAHEMNEPYWKGAAEFWASYVDVMNLRSMSVGETVIRIDPSAIIVEAINRLKSSPELLSKYRSMFTTILIDEFQESDKSQRELLDLIAPKDTIFFLDAESAVGRFRGADPDSVERYVRENTSTQITLEKVHRFNGDRVEEAAKLASHAEAAQYIAHALKRSYLHDGLPWSEMAVLVRNPGLQVAALQRALAQNGIPLSVDAGALALADNPAVRPILDIANFALRPHLLTPGNWERIEAVLLSEFCGADALELRQIRVKLAKERIDGDSKTTTEMALELIDDPTISVDSEFRPFARLRDLLVAARKASRGDVSDVLWAIWDSSMDYNGARISLLWRERALNGGNKGALADRDIDSVIQLFESARRFSERAPGARATTFIDQLFEERILSDAIFSKAQKENVVSLLTVHSAKGLEWKFVALAGLQEGAWPNLKERGSLLGSERLVEAERTGLRSPGEIAASASYGLMKDERRLLNVARTRANSRLLVTAVQAEDLQPSRFFDEIYEEIYGVSSDEGEHATSERALTPQALISQLRRVLEGGVEGDKEFAASLLKSLASEGFSSANPSTWLGARPLSSEAPVVAKDQSVFVSPSGLQSFEDCGLKWFLEKNGARDGDSTAQLLGTAIHALARMAADDSTLTLEEAIEKLTDSWSIVDQSVGWFKEAQLLEARAMLKRFFDWHRENEREIVAVEEKFKIEIGRAILSGSVDRLESDGKSLHVVDLKTGATAISPADALEHKQLAAYQLAVMEGGFAAVSDIKESGGAQLLFVAGDRADAALRTQPTVDRDAVAAEIESAADGMSANQFTATLNKNCRTCSVKLICPLQANGRSVIE
ncbi:MAG: ATP-dependent DNA helicase [Actinomycetes bacterium]